ncbi:MAG: TspO/MBR family protein [archaeon]
MKKKHNLALIISFVTIFLVAFIGSFLTDSKSSWYESIKPSITPPNFVFPIAWTTIFILLAFSLYFSWVHLKDQKKVILFYGINFVLNILWSLFFFTLKNPTLALVDIVPLWVSILGLFLINWKKNKISSWLVLPYLLWVTFATILNVLMVI